MKPGNCLPHDGEFHVPDVIERAVGPSDDERGVAWWNGLSKTARAFWIDRAWRATSPDYSLDALPSPADAWHLFQREQVPA